MQSLLKKRKEERIQRNGGKSRYLYSQLAGRRLTIVARQQVGLVASGRRFHRTFSAPIGGCHGKWQSCRVGGKVRDGEGWVAGGTARWITTTRGTHV